MRLFVSGSMGATVSLNAMTHGVEAPACWYGVKPAVDPTRMDAVPGANRIISEAFDGQPIPADRNPALNIDKFSTETRYRMVASVNDQWVRYDENTGLLAEGLEDRGADVSILPVTGTHDDPLHFDVGDLVDFASTCGDLSRRQPSSAGRAEHPLDVDPDRDPARVLPRLAVARGVPLHRPRHVVRDPR